VTPYDAKTHAGGRLVQDAESGRWHVEWREVEKQNEPFNPALVEFRKDDEGGEAISGKKQAKDSLKRAKKDRKNRLKAEAAAEAARAKLNKGDQMEKPIVTVAKAFIERGRAPRIAKKVDFYKALVDMARLAYPEERRPAIRFNKFLQSGDPNAVVLWKSYRLADGPEPTTADGEDSLNEHQPDTYMPETSAAYDEIARKAKKLAAREGIRFSVAFSRIASARPDLMAVDKAHHFAKISKAMGTGG
jgi:hypothetical protein